MSFKKSSKNYHLAANWSEQHQSAAAYRKALGRSVLTAKANTLIN